MKLTLLGLIGIVAASVVFAGSSNSAAAGTPAVFAQLTSPVAASSDVETPPLDRLASFKVAPDWRYRYYNGRWWYWTTASRWVVWNNGGWVDYRPGLFAADVVRRDAVRAVAPYRVTTGYRGEVYRDGYRDGYRRAARINNTVRIGRFR